MTIILYDIPSTTPGNAWSANTWKTRYTLNYKEIPYTTEWIEYPDIEKLSKKFHIKPTSKKEDGRDHYTLPAIHDPSTGVYLADSVLIAEYLEKTYPDTPPLFPSNTIGLQCTFYEAFWELLTPIVGFTLLTIRDVLNPVSKEYFERTRQAALGKTLDEIMLKGENAIEQWGKLQANFGKIDNWYAKTDGLGPFLMGNEVSWADILVAAHLICVREVWGKNDQKWKDIVRWNGGRWGAFMQSMEKYAAVC